MSDVLFEVTKDCLETGMRGYPVGYCVTSSVDATKGLFYVGKAVSELKDWQPEHVIYLLFHGRQGSKEEVAAFAADLNGRALCSKELEKHIRMLPKHGHPMELFSAALLIAGIYEKTGDYQQDCLNIIAKAPFIAASVINYHAGWGENNHTRPELGYIENFIHMLNIPHRHKEEMTDVFKLFNILHYDHGGGNLSAFVGKAVASGLEDMYGSMSAAMCGLAGPRHGRANQDCLVFVNSILKDLGEDATEQQVEDLIRKKLSNNELVFGFGHAVLRVEDPRATVLYDLANERYSGHPLIKIAKSLRSRGPKVLQENPKISNPFPNVDGISGSVLTAAGFPYSDYFTVLFGMARIVGISIQIFYERCVARDGKGTPIIRPKYIYKSR